MKNHKRKQTKKYYFSVEGETEKMYLEWLQKKINEEGDLKFNISFDIKVEKNPLSMIKSEVILGGENIFHFFDFESPALCHIKSRDETFRKLKEAKAIKRVNYRPAYSNFCFELWILLHKKCLRKTFTDRRLYLKELNKIFNKKFVDLREVKHKANFNSILSSLKFEDFLLALRNSEIILEDCKRNSDPIKKYGFEFFENNPSTSVGTVFISILKDCGFNFS